MSKIYWVATVALGLIFLISPVYAPPLEYWEDRGAEHRNSGKDSVQEQRIEPPSLMDPAHPTQALMDKYNIESTRYADSNYKYYFLLGEGLAQWIMAIASIVAIVLRAWAVWLLNKTLKETRRMAQEAEQATKAAQNAVAVTQKIGEAQTRAYLTCVSGRLRKGTINGCMAIKCEVRLENGGQSPSLGVRVRGLVSIDDSIHEPFKIFAHCSIVDAGKERSAESQDWIFQDIRGLGSDIGRFGKYSVTGSIFWRDVFGGSHETEFELRQISGGWMNEEMGVIDYILEGVSTVMRIDGIDPRYSHK